LTDANTYTVLSGSAAFVDALQADVATCKHKLYMQFMTYEGDAVGKTFAEPLIKKAHDGADVRLIVDYYSDNILSDVYPFSFNQKQAYKREKADTLGLFKRLESVGVGVKRTNPFGPLWAFFFYRDHKKIVIVDNHIAYLGGINISEHNFAWHDYMVRIEGPIVQQITADFLATWAGTRASHQRTDSQSDYIVNQGVGDPAVYQEIITMIDKSRHTIMIECPYVVGHDIEAALKRAAERGVKITLIVPHNVNIVLFKWWLKATMRYLDHPNVAFYGFTTHDGMTHAKLYIFDNQWASFGSLNISELEGIAHREINVFSQNKALIDQLNTLAEQDLAQSVRLEKPTQSAWRPPYTWFYALYMLLTNILLKSRRWQQRFG
jgi:cardiolipin synthase A/B